MDIRQGIFDTAQALGIQPVDLATAISYETAGTFDPTKRGPTTQWGQHRGLIQFGEPQAKKYGVDWNNPLGSQLGPQGAVANYLRDTGVQPGMGLLDIYSAINAGGVGRYNRSDANNGGAPGNVRDKVEKQMAGHRRKAEQMFGSQGIADDAMAALGKAPQQSPPQIAPQGAQMQPNQQPDQQRQNMFLKNMDPATRDRLIMAMQGMTMNPNQGLMGMAQQNMQDRATAGREAKAEAKGAEQRNRTAEWLMTQPGGEQYAQAIANGALPAAQALQMWQKASAGGGPVERGLNPQYGVDANGNPVLIQLGKDGTAAQTQMPDGVTLSKEPIRLDAGTEWVLLDPITRQPIGRIPKNNREAAAETAAGAAEGKAEVESTLSAPRAVAQAQEGMALIDSIINDPALPSITGMVQGRMPPMSQAGTDLNVKIEQLQGKAFLEAFESLKGGGAITEREGQAAQNAMARLQRAQSTEAYVEALNELRSIMGNAMQRAQGGAGSPPPTNESDGWQVINGVRIREVR